MIRMERRVETPRWLNWVVPLASFAVALVLGAVLLLATGNDPLDTYSRVLDRAVVSDGALSGTLVAASPLLFTGLAAAVAFRVGLFNIGGEGQLMIGAASGTWAALALGADASGPVVVAAMIVAGALGGALWAAVVGVLRAYFQTNEIITSLMLNYVAIQLGTYLIFGSESFLRELEGTGRMFPQGRKLAEVAFWPVLEVGGVAIPFGFLLGAVVAVALLLVQRATRFGFELRVLADSPNAARYAGIRTKRTMVALLALSGAVAGLAGAANVGDSRHVFDPKGIQQGGYGYTGIVVAALARLNPIATIFVAVIMGGLANAGRALQGPDFPAGLVGTLQGLLLVCTLGGEVFARYRIRRRSTLPVGDHDAAHAAGAAEVGT